MRKGILIAAVGLGVVAVVVYVFLIPRKGSVDWHKREHAKAWADVQKLRAGSGGFVQDLRAWRNEKRMKFHFRALFEAGYLTNETFTVSNKPAWIVASVAMGDALSVFTNTGDSTREFLFIEDVPPSTNAVFVIGPTESMKKVAELIRKADVPGELIKEANAPGSEK